MSKIDTGGAAFPRPVGHYPHVGCTYSEQQSGMTLRDYFAGQALIGLLANNNLAHIAVTDSFAIADMMIEARSGHGRPTGEA